MKKCITFLLLHVVLLSSLSAQVFSDESGNTYALVVGISEYQHISNLKFAHRDAEIFKNYLRSNAGGNVPEENIYFFTNASATSPAIYDALYQIKRKAQENDKVIIYFSGHGQRETDEYNNLGYLLTYNTPKSNFRNNALRIEDLNLDSQTLTLKKGAEVIFFIDACYAGELSGVVNKGPDLSARELETQSNKEVRFMSCRAKEKSLEVSELDGGRGVFSHFLVKGLMGEADKGPNGVVTKKELENYLEEEIERFMSTRTHEQTPVIQGENNSFNLAMVDNELFSLLKSSAGSALAALRMDFSDEEPPMAAAVMAEPSLESAVEPAEIELTRGIENEKSASETYLSFLKAINSGNLTTLDGESSAYKVYQDQLATSTDKEELARMKSKLVVALQEKAQGAINAYLQGDYEELSLRLYTRYADSYAQYPEYLNLAAELVGPEYATYNAIRNKQYYFAGINYRLNHLMGTEYAAEDMQRAIALQEQALAFDDKAAYVYNELGILYNIKGDRQAATSAFEKAHRNAPEWVIPLTNLAGQYLALDKQEEARSWALKATALIPNYAAANMILGRLSTLENNHLFAEMYFRRALLDNWLSHRPFEALADYYTLVGQYELSDHLYKEAAFRKRGLQPIVESLVGGLTVNGPTIDGPPLPIDEAEMLNRIRNNRDDYEAWYLLGLLYTREDRFVEAESSFLQVYRIQPAYCPLYYGIGSLYEKWNRYDDAILWFRDGLELSEGASDEEEVIGDCYNGSYAQALFPLYETLERNTEAERIIIKYKPYALWEFYDRMVSRYPQDPDSWYKRGLQVYDLNIKENSIVSLGATVSHIATWYEEVFGEVTEEKIDSNGLITMTFEVKQKVSKERSYTFPENKAWETFWGNPVIVDFEQTLKLSPQYPTRWDIHLKLAKLYQIRSEQYLDAVFEEGRMLIEGIVDEQPIQYERYQNYIKAAKTAISNAESALSIYPDQSEARYRLVDLYQSIFEPERALDLYREVRDSNWINPEYRRKWSMMQMLMGQVDSAYHSLSFAFDQNVGPNRQDHEVLSWILQFKGDYKEALQELDEIEDHYDQVSGTTIRPAELHYRRAVLHALNNKSKKARNALKAAFEAGFDYRHVVQNDPAFDNLRKQSKFQDLLFDYGMDDTRIVD